MHNLFPYLWYNFWVFGKLGKRLEWQVFGSVDHSMHQPHLGDHFIIFSLSYQLVVPLNRIRIRALAAIRRSVSRKPSKDGRKYLIRISHRSSNTLGANNKPLGNLPDKPLVSPQLLGCHEGVHGVCDAQPQPVLIVG